MTLYRTRLAAHEDAANAPSVGEFAAPLPQNGIQDDEFGRWLEAQSALFRGKRPVAQVPALLNRALLAT